MCVVRRRVRSAWRVARSRGKDVGAAASRGTAAWTAQVAVRGQDKTMWHTVNGASVELWERCGRCEVRAGQLCAWTSDATAATVDAWGRVTCKRREECECGRWAPA